MTSMPDIYQQIEEIAAGFQGVISLAAKDLRTGASVLYHADRKCPAASVIKLPILVHVLLLEREGFLSTDEEVSLSAESKVPGSGILTQLSEGLTLPLRDACTLMIALSDNTATNLILDRTGVQSVTDRMRALGYPRTKLFRKVFSSGPPVSEENRRYGLGVTTPRDMLRLLSDIHSGRIGDAQTCARIRAVLGTQHYRDGIPRLLPASYQFQGKSGAVDAVRNDVGFVTVAEGRDIALAIFCQKMAQPMWTADNPGWLVIARLARALVDRFVSSPGPV
jgi:beta-lactamase class A